MKVSTAQSHLPANPHPPRPERLHGSQYPPVPPGTALPLVLTALVHREVKVAFGVWIRDNYAPVRPPQPGSVRTPLPSREHPREPLQPPGVRQG